MINKITFRSLEEKDLRLLHNWLNTYFVMEWYNKAGSSYENVVKKYLPRIHGEQPTHPYIIVCDSIDIGYIQTYRIDDYPEYSKFVGEDIPSAGVDLFIGEKEYIHKGLGKQILLTFLKDYVFTISAVECCVIGPDPMNKIAISAYEKVGFKYDKTVYVPDEDEAEYLMKIYKCDVVDSDSR